MGPQPWASKRMWPVSCMKIVPSKSAGDVRRCVERVMVCLGKGRVKRM